MVALVLGLKVRLLGSYFKTPSASLVGIILGWLAALWLSGLLVFGLLATRLMPTEVAGGVLVAASALALVGAILAPLLFRLDDTLDTRTLGQYGIAAPVLARSLVLAAVVGPFGVVLLAMLFGFLLASAVAPGAAILGVVAALVLVASCAVAVRIGSGFAAALLANRRIRDLALVIGTVLLIGAAPLLMLLLNGALNSGDALLTVTMVLSWLPFGAPGGAVAAVLSGAWGVALLKLAIAAVTLVGLWFAWTWLVRHQLRTVARETSGASHRGLGLFRLFPASQWGVIAARSITNALRDPRYIVTYVSILVVPILIAFPLALTQESGMPVGLMLIAPVFIVAALAGFAPHNDLAYDDTGFWQHVSAGVKGVPDRIGRAFPYLVFGGVYTLIVAVVLANMLDRVAMLPVMLGLGAALLGGGLGLSSITSALIPYPVAKPEQSPFTTPPGAGTIGALVQGGVLLGTIILSVPTIVLMVLSFNDAGFVPWAGLVGFVTGLLALAGGIFFGGRILDARSTKVLAWAMRQ
ncbi:hypothetical protein [Humidisolicoccus flavus]|uniref:hypothetical protein n=1 Tax=Humidisolicoccus flavus TaxID=3111414 RepID=UPI00324A2C0A